MPVSWTTFSPAFVLGTFHENTEMDLVLLPEPLLSKLNSETLDFITS